MIRLTIHSTTGISQHSFQKTNIIIGFGPSEQVDLVLPDPTLQLNHVQIIHNLDHFMVINHAYDPHVLLNGLCFGKRALKNGDRLTIHFTDILFEEIKETERSTKELEQVLEQKMAAPLEVKEEWTPYSSTNNLENIYSEELEEDLQALQQELYAEELFSQDPGFEKLSIADMESLIAEAQQLVEEDRKIKKLFYNKPLKNKKSRWVYPIHSFQSNYSAQNWLLLLIFATSIFIIAVLIVLSRYL